MKHRLVAFFWGYGRHMLAIVAFLGACYHFQYHKHLDTPYWPPHTWRQADAMAIAVHFYQNGMDLSDPRILNELNPVAEGRAAGEFPLLYYTAAGLFHLTGGPSVLVFRALWLTIWLAGLWALFDLVYRKTKFFLLSAAIPVLVFSSPVAVAYAPSFVPNLPAMAFALLGLNFLDRYLQHGALKRWYAAAGFFLLAGLTKVTMLALPLAMLGVVAITGLWHLLHKRTAPALQVYHPIHLAAGFIALFVPVILWFQYVFRYNAENINHYFQTGTTPYWSLSEKRLAEISEQVGELWQQFYYSEQMQEVLWVLLALLPILWLLRPGKGGLLVFGLALGFAMYVLLFYYAFLNHDYYALDPLLLVALGLAVVAVQLKKILGWRLWRHTLVRSVLVIAVVYQTLTAADYGKHKFRERFNWWAGEMLNPHLDDPELQQKMLAAGIGPDAKVFTHPDFSPNRNLSLLQRHGYNQFTLAIHGIPLTQAERLKDWGAEYAIFTTWDAAREEQIPVSFRTDTLFYYKGILAFRIQ